jgi:hypothetical protein
MMLLGGESYVCIRCGDRFGRVAYRSASGWSVDRAAP